MDERQTFCEAVRRPERNMAVLCREYKISRTTGYKWLKRSTDAEAQGLQAEQAVQELPRRPHSSPKQTPKAMETAVLEVREAHPTWGGRKLHHALRQQLAGSEGGSAASAAASVPAASTITAILRRTGCLDPAESVHHKPYVRFAMAAPNELWQIDYKGCFTLGDGVICHPLTVLDDHSRFLLNLGACADERLATVQAQVTQIFNIYGLPARMLMDNGAPWGFDPEAGLTRPYYTRFTVWLLRLGIAVSHGRVRHPQTQGKDERLHRSLKLELLQHAPPAALANLTACQATFDAWRPLHNNVRPHVALGDDPPAKHYQPSPRPMPTQLPTLIYDEDSLVRKVDAGGRFAFRSRAWSLGKTFAGNWIGLQATDQDGLYSVFFGAHKLAEINLNGQTQPNQCVNYLSEHL